MGMAAGVGTGVHDSGAWSDRPHHAQCDRQGTRSWYGLTLPGFANLVAEGINVRCNVAEYLVDCSSAPSVSRAEQGLV